MRSTIRVGITLALVALALFAGYWLWQHYLYSPWTRDARIRADVVTIAPTSPEQWWPWRCGTTSGSSVAICC